MKRLIQKKFALLMIALSLILLIAPAVADMGPHPETVYDR